MLKVAFAAALLCAAVTPLRAEGGSFSGPASYYGSESGKWTASGARFNPNALTCAHRTLPFGTRLRVTYRGRSVIVTVNDRGPFIKGRVLDLSTAAARAIGLTHAGVGHVTAEIIWPMDRRRAASVMPSSIAPASSRMIRIRAGLEFSRSRRQRWCCRSNWRPGPGRRSVRQNGGARGHEG
jgi:rare lipoprotein A (peptidoglycan hydrolase)